MTESPEHLYLDLMKKTLSFMLWTEPPQMIDSFTPTRSRSKRLVAAFVSRILRSQGLHLVKDRSVTEEEREEGRIWPNASFAVTMIGLKRLNNIQFCVETVIQEGVPGDLIETGVWRGGACILMRAVLAAYGIRDRKVFAADSFEGLPEPDPARYPSDVGDEHHTFPYLAVSKEEVAENFRKYGLLDDQVVFLKGWFKDTLPIAPIQSLAVMRLDGDMYESTMDALVNLYPKLSSGGFCVVDDYASTPTCKRAVDDYRRANGISETLVQIDYAGVYWRKS